MTALPSSTPVGVIGAGTMGAGIAQVAAEAGHPVVLYDMAAGAAEAGRARIEAGLAKLAARGKRTSDHVAETMARISASEAFEDLASVGLAVEAIVEKRDAKSGLFARLEDLLSADAILASNTSSISISAISAGLSRPERLVGMHFFNPAPVMKLVEVVSGLATAPEVATTVADTAEAWGKVTVRVASTPGFIVNRIARPFYGEALDLLEAGRCDAATLDAILTEGAGFRMGPAALMDLIGHDVNYAVTTSVFEATFQDPRYRPSHLQRELVAAGWLGRKSGRGLYDHSEAGKLTSPSDFVPVDAAAVDDFDFAQGGTCGGVAILPGDGHSATWLSAERGVPVLAYDLIPDGVQCRRLALASSPGVAEAVTERFAATCLKAGMTATRLADGPGLPVARVLAMLANEAFDLVQRGGATAADADLAMVQGVNYPQGPIAWAEQIGLGRLAGVLDAMVAETGDPRYRVSPGLRLAALRAAA